MNPEFKRNIWLEITPARLAMMPGVLTLIGLLILTLDKNNPQQGLYTTFTSLFFVLTTGWGSLLVLSSINSEVNEHTWDQQRLSALTPWQMAWGKLFGSTAYAWYGGLLCALVATLSALTTPDFWPRSTWLLVGIMGAVALHAWILAGRLHTLDTRSAKASGMAGWLFGLLLLVQGGSMILHDPLSPKHGEPGIWWNWGLPLHLQSLVVCSLALALGLLALWRSMGKQLMVRTLPWAWIAGVLGTGLVLAGYVPRPAGLASVWLTLAGTALAATYFALFTEPNNRLVWQAVFFYQAQGATRRMWQSMPLWPVSWGLAALLVLLAAITPHPPLAAYNANMDSALGLVALHCLRDCGIYHVFALRNTPRKPTGMTLLAIFLLGTVLPGLVNTLSPEQGYWVEPLFGLRNLLNGDAAHDGNIWIAMAIQLAVVAGLVAWRWNAGQRATPRT